MSKYEKIASSVMSKYEKIASSVMNIGCRDSRLDPWEKYKAFSYHGGPYDRGSADSWYNRPKDPHKYPTGTLNCPKVTDLTPEELEAYHAGYDEQEATGDHKDWG